MGITIEKIEENAQVEYKGDVRITGSIGKNAVLMIKDGSLMVDGNIESNTQITLTQENTSNTAIKGLILINNVSFAQRSIRVHGRVEDGVIISAKAANIKVDGNIGSQCRFDLVSGDIQVGEVGNNSILKTISGDVNTGNVGTHCSLKTVSGNVNVKNVGILCTLKTVSGNVMARQVESNSTLDTVSGHIYENGVKRTNKKAQRIGTNLFSSNSFSINGLSITRLENGASYDKPTPTDETPSSSLQLCVMVLGGFIAAAGIVAAALAFTVFSATFGGSIIASFGFAAIFVGVVLFAVHMNCQTSSEDSLDVSSNMVLG